MPAPIYICGPTASGKSSLAIKLAKRIDGEIVNGDAYQIYRGIETLSAAPSSSEKSQIPHHLFAVLPPSEAMDAQRFRKTALPVIEEIQSRGKSPIVVGGSGMYLKFLTHGPSPVPAGDEELRAELEERELQDLARELAELDPEGAAMTNLKNRRYVLRALEICLLSGQKMSDLKTDWAKASQKIESGLKGGVLWWEPETLRERIYERTSLMLQHGAIEEVIALEKASSTCKKAIGVEAIEKLLRGEINLERCHELIYFATCQYAKRQRTWFKKEQWLHKIPMPQDAPLEEMLRLLELK